VKGAVSGHSDHGNQAAGFDPKRPPAIANQPACVPSSLAGAGQGPVYCDTTQRDPPGDQGAAEPLPVLYAAIPHINSPLDQDLECSTRA
jgi:hypothetical protein